MASNEAHVVVPSDFPSQSHRSEVLPADVHTLWPGRGSDGWYQLSYLTGTAVLMSTLLLLVHFVFLHWMAQTTLMRLSSQVAIGTVRLLYQL